MAWSSYPRAGVTAPAPTIVTSRSPITYTAATATSPVSASVGAPYSAGPPAMPVSTVTYAAPSQRVVTPTVVPSISTTFTSSSINYAPPSATFASSPTAITSQSPKIITSAKVVAAPTFTSVPTSPKFVTAPQTVLSPTRVLAQPTRQFISTAPQIYVSKAPAVPAVSSTVVRAAAPADTVAPTWVSPIPPAEAAAETVGASPFDELWPAYEAKMLAGGKESASAAAISAFRYNFEVLTSGMSTMIPESEIGPVAPLPELDNLQIDVQPELLMQTVVLKLNGGLGTGMGLEKAKSLLPVIEGNTFLDLIAQQVEYMKMAYNIPDLKFMLMNSFSTSQDTLEALSKYPSLGTGDDLEFLQNKAPKVTADGFAPVSWPANPEHEWCPPGHGDLYPAMIGSGTLDKLIEKGCRYMFVSNSDNLGATMDLKLLTYFAQMNLPFMMEVAARTEADKKGGHLATSLETGGLTLRESAQCPKEDEPAFQDITKYTYFNTNNLWVDLLQLRDAFDQYGGFLPLPVMKNDKTVDPRDKKSTKVVQLETAMGAAISCFGNAAAILVPRTRFAPVKKCDDLLALRSDAYVLTEDYRIQLAPERNGIPPNIKLDDMYKFVDSMDTMIPNGVPSLIGCNSLKIEGPIEFEAGVVIRGDVKIKASQSARQLVPAGLYENQELNLP